MSMWNVLTTLERGSISWSKVIFAICLNKACVLSSLRIVLPNLTISGQCIIIHNTSILWNDWQLAERQARCKEINQVTIAHIIILLATGIGIGFAGGLLGVGGSFIMTPVQYMIYTDMGLPTDIAIKLAFGTSLLVVLLTALSGAWRHSKLGAVYWKAAIIMGSCGLIAAFGGATLAAHLPGEALKIAFGIIILLSGIRMLTAKLPTIEMESKDKPWLWIAWAIPIGFVTGIIGIGGGVLLVPVMVLVLKFKMHNAVATSLAMMLFTSTGGTIGYIVNGLGVSDLPAYSIGYVNLLSWFLLAVTSVGLAQVGAITAHKLPAKQLRYIFIAVMFYMGLKMLGVFDWLGWPI
jgi:uncharacterized membrane protein YfcA